MQTHLRTLVVVTTSGALALFMASPIGAQTPAPTTQSAPGIEGAWQLNRELSTDLSKMDGRGQQPPDGRAGGAGVGGRGGRVGGGRSGGSRPGGMGRGGGGAAGGGGAVKPEEQLKMRAVMRELNDPPERLDVTVKDQQLILTGEGGVVHAFPIGDKKSDVDFGTAKIEVKTSWDGPILSQELDGGPIRLTRTFQTTVEGNQLVVTMAMKSGGAGRGGLQVPLRFIYDRQ